MRILIYSASGLIGINILKKYSQTYSDIEIVLISERQIPKIFYNLMGIDSEKFSELRSINGLKSNFDEIYHCGYSSQPSIFIKDSIKTIEKNILITPKLISLLMPNGKIFFMSSSEVYSGCTELPCDESHLGNIIKSGERSIYLMSKLITERLILDLISSNQKAFIIRVSLVYGPGIFKDDTRVIYKFINEALLGKIVLSGSQNAIRRYLFIDDFIDMLIEIKNHDAGIYNLGGKEPISIIQLANLIATITGSSLEIISTENQQKDSSPPEVNISMAKLENQITYRNNVSLQSGIEKIINWLKMIEN